MTLTGNTRHRLGWFGRLILQVEYSWQHSGSGRLQPGVSFTSTGWRDATVVDIQALAKVARATDPTPGLGPSAALPA